MSFKQQDLCIEQAEAFAKETGEKSDLLSALYSVHEMNF